MAGLSDFKKRQPTGWFKIDEEETKTVFIPAELREMTRAVVHAKPSDYTKNAICTWTEEGLCYACQQGTFQWRPQVKVYIPVIEKGKTAIMVQGTGVNSLFWELSKVFQETGTSVGWYEITRSGKGKRTKYTAIPVDNAFPVRYTSKVDLRNHLNKIDYTEQQNYYN